MDSFLGLVAEDLLTRFPNFENLTLIFPNKRAALFIADELKRLVNRPIWMPEILTLDEFIARYTLLKRIDEVESVVKLYKIFREDDPELELPEFYYWGKMLLGDFDDVDKYLVDAHDLFGNVDKYREMDDASLSYLTSEQKEALRRFFNIVAESNSDESRDFQDLWNRIEELYNRFREILQSEGKAYAGMAQRYFVERELWPDVEHIAFVGFNALNRCEKAIFDHYHKADSALFYWDYDTYYINNEQHEAGYYLRDNLKRYPNALSETYFNRLSRLSQGGASTEEIKVTVIDVPNVIAQAKLLPELLGSGAGRESAVVLCDEGLLIPVRNSFPENIKNINITMGMPAKGSSIASLLEQLYALLAYGTASDTYYYKPVLGILEHPLIMSIDSKQCVKLVNEINGDNLYRISREKLLFNDVCRAIFGGNAESISQWLNSIFEAILSHSSLKNRVVDREVLFKLYTYVKQLDSIFIQEGIATQVMSDAKFYISMINRLLSFISIPFAGQPLQGVQLMGLMETRMLDFEKVVLLSVNEGVMPKGGVAPSFVPVSFRRAFGMPVPEHQDALFAYYFYRLIQRAKRVVMVYVSGRGNGLGAEMSRFILQLKYESNLKIEWKSLQNTISPIKIESVDVVRTDTMLSKLREHFAVTDKKKRALSPSALSYYIKCPLQFFRTYVEGLGEADSVADEIDARMVGNYLHSVADMVYSYLNLKCNGGFITAEMLSEVLNDDAYIDNVMQKGYEIIMDPNGKIAGGVNSLGERGVNVIARMTVERYLRDIIRYDCTVAPFRVVKLEEKVYMPIELPDGTQLIVGGVVDRIDQLENGTYRIIDYKTGADKRTFSTMEELFDIGGNKHEKAPFQTMLYALAYIRQCGLTDAKVVPGIYLLREMTGSGDSFDWHFEYEQGVLATFDDAMRNEFMHNLLGVISDMFRVSDKVGVSTDHSNCKYCDFKSLCNVE